jgi:DNA polymerase III sliding clamp (beta) subunit (PCNA family)
MTTTNRDSLLKLVSLLRPALSNQSFIPALTHLRFDAGQVTAYNDVTAIKAKAPIDLSACVPGELFIKALSSFNADTVALSELDGSTLLLTAGRSKLKVPVLPVKDFPLREPSGNCHVIPFDNEMLDGIRKCLFSAGADPTHPAQMGVTLECEDGKAVLYSSDNFTISRCQTKSKLSLPADAPVILPTFFCEQMLVLAKTYSDDDVDLEVYPNALRCTFGKKASLLTKTVADLEPLDFQKIMGKYLKLADVKKHLGRIPDSFDTAWNRALLVLANEADKATRVDGGKGRVLLESRSALGEANDELEYEGPEPKGQFHVDPTLVVRAAKTCGSIAFYDRVLVLASDDASFIHLIAHCSA